MANIIAFIVLIGLISFFVYQAKKKNIPAANAPDVPYTNQSPQDIVNSEIQKYNQNPPKG